MPTVRAGDVDIAYEVTGDGPALLMIMGLAADSRMWILQLPAFSPRYRCITLDNRGVGGSSTSGEHTIEDMASDAIAVLDDAGIDRAHVLGISLGGAIAQHVALKAPDRVRSLVLAATWCERNPYIQRMAEVGRVIAGIGHETLVRASLLWLFTPRFILEQDALLNTVERMWMDLHPPMEVFFTQVSALLEHDVRERLGGLDLPARVITGTRDILVATELSERVAQAIPGADLARLDGGHAFNMENAEAFNRAVLEFLDAH